MSEETLKLFYECSARSRELLAELRRDLDAMETDLRQAKRHVGRARALLETEPTPVPVRKAAVAA